MASSPKQSSTDGEKSPIVETLRGLACILLVAFHVVGDNQGMGMRVADASVYRSFTDLLLHLRMPLFTFLSGFVYAYRPVEAGRYGAFLKKKLGRLLLPLLSVSTLYFLVQMVTPGINRQIGWTDWAGIYVLPYAHFWFLQAMMVLFCVLAILERLGALQTFGRYLMLLAACFLVHFTVRIHPSVFSLDQATYLLPFFVLGLGVNRFGAHVQRWTGFRQAVLALFAILMLLHAMASFGDSGEVAEKRTVFATLLGVTGLLALYFWIRPAQVLIDVGKYSFTIYLYHVFFTAGVRILLERTGVSVPAVVFVAGCTLGLLGPVLVERMLRPYALPRRVLLGQ